LHFVRDDREPITDFARALEAEDERIRNNWAFGRYASRGFYHAQLKRYFDVFDRNQIKVYLYEDLSADPVSILQDAFEFLGVDEAFAPDVSVKPNVSGIPQNKALHILLTRQQRIKAVLKPRLPAKLLRFASDLRDKNLAKPQLSPEVRGQLIEMYREDILRLQDLIDRDLSRWLER
jgi:hypothetical protein